MAPTLVLAVRAAVVSRNHSISKRFHPVRRSAAQFCIPIGVGAVVRNSDADLQVFLTIVRKGWSSPKHVPSIEVDVRESLVAPPLAVAVQLLRVMGDQHDLSKRPPAWPPSQRWSPKVLHHRGLSPQALDVSNSHS